MVTRMTTPYFYDDIHEAVCDSAGGIVMTAGSSAFAFSFWIYLGHDAGNSMVPLELTNSARNDGVFLQIGGNPTTAEIRIATLGANTGDVSSAWKYRSWNHIGMNYDQANTRVEIFCNGVRTYNNASYTEQSAISLGDARIGLGNAPAQSGGCAYARVGIWDKALSIGEMDLLAKGAFCDQVARSNLVAYYEPSESWKDKVGNAHLGGPLLPQARIRLPDLLQPRGHIALADPLPDTRVLDVPQVWTKQPPAGTPVDWNNPQVSGLVACFVFNEATGRLTDLVGPRSSSTGGTPQSVATPQGLAHAFGGTSDRYVVPHRADLDADSDFTVICGLTNQEANQNIEFLEKQSGNPMWQFYNSAGGNVVQFYGRDTGGTLLTLTSTSTLDVGKYMQVAGVKSVGDDWVYLYVDGVLEDDVQDTSDGDWSNAADMLIADGGGTGMFNGYIHYLYIFQDAKNPEQIKSLHENPWQIFKADNLHVPIEYEELTFDEDKEERLFMIPQKNTRQPK